MDRVRRTGPGQRPDAALKRMMQSISRDNVEGVMIRILPFRSSCALSLGLILLLSAMLLFAMASPASAQQSFRTGEEAAEALVSAVRTDDRQRVLAVLGRYGADIISSGDDVADAEMRKLFLAAYD